MPPSTDDSAELKRIIFRAIDVKEGRPNAQRMQQAFATRDIEFLIRLVLALTNETLDLFPQASTSGNRSPNTSRRRDASNSNTGPQECTTTP